ncbi:MAG: alpha/beta fold hydrolase [Balneola sp.]|nr:MAG: alpha/beta fold hydrolase [Balneola sp.]
MSAYNNSFTSSWWALNGHIHTIAFSFSKVREVAVTREEIPTPDDDFLEIDLIDLNNQRPVVALFHGLEGSSKRVYIRNLMHDLRDIGISSVALNFRGCGSRLNLKKRFYHSGETSDYATFFEWINSRFINNPVFAVGFSLGGNALIKYLAENAKSTIVSKAVAVSPPYELKAGSLNLDHGFNRIYSYRFIRTLKEKLTLKRITYPDLPEFSGSSLYQFDDQVTAPVHGFRDAEDYYESCSSARFLNQVSTPILLIHSHEDPLCPLDYAPFDIIEKNRYISSTFTRKGGHVGFIGKPENWMNKTIINWLML